MNEDFHVLRARPVPDGTEQAQRKEGYRHGLPIDLEGPANREDCLNATAHGLAGRNHYAHPANPPYFLTVPGSIDGLLVRRGVLARLEAASRRLADMSLELYLFDAWRPQAVQRFFHDIWMPEQLKARRPDLEGDALLREVETYWAAPTTSAQSPSPHSTGGAVDLTLVWLETHQPLYMGSLFDDPTDLAWTDWFERTPPAFPSDEEARANRRLLHWVMAEAGFANNPSEWWHFSFGDQMWAKLTGASCALYGGCDPLGNESG